MTTDDTNAHHVIAEIPGTDPEIGDEVVMVFGRLEKNGGREAAVCC